MSPVVQDRTKSRSFVDWFKEVQPAVIPGNHDAWLDDSTESVQHGEAAEIAGPYDFLFWRSEIQPHCGRASSPQQVKSLWHVAAPTAIIGMRQMRKLYQPRQSMLKRTAPVVLSGKSKKVNG